MVRGNLKAVAFFVALQREQSSRGTPLFFIPPFMLRTLIARWSWLAQKLESGLGENKKREPETVSGWSI